MEKLREENRAFEQMIDAAPTGFCTVGLDGRFVRVNPKFCEMVGYEADELMKMTFADLTHSKDVDQDNSAFQRMISGEMKTYSREKRYKRKDGRLVWVNLTSSIMHDLQGRPLNFVTVLQDITPRKIAQAQLAASERRFRTLFQQAPLSVQLLGLDGRTLKVNAAWEELWQIPKDVISNYILQEYNVLTDPQLKEKGITPYFEAAYAGESKVLPPILYDPTENGLGGRPRWLTAYVHPIKNSRGQVVEVMLIHHDISERIAAEEQLKEAKEYAESANRLKSSFLANMSHEIRTPLGAILGFTEMLKDEQLDQDTRREYLEIIERSGHSLTQIINDILDLSRVESGNFKVEKILLRPQGSVEEALGLLKLEAAKKNLSLRLNVQEDAPEFITTDAVRLKQIVINLVGNAIKFTEKGEITVTLAAGEDGGLSVLVKDTGIGIPQENQSALFQPFSQLDGSNTRRFGGTGLGLALSRRLANMLGGEITLLESVPGQGSTFLFTHPSSPPPAAFNETAPPVAPSEAKSLLGMKILVADDSEDNRYLLEVLLKKQKAETSFACDGQQALDMVSAGDFDLVLMDVQMPVMDGLEATRRLRSAGFHKPIIALTAHAMKEDLERSLSSGCDAHVSKPVSSDTLVNAIVGLTNRKA